MDDTNQVDETWGAQSACSEEKLLFSDKPIT
jgi:hypothetical protein